MTDPRQPDTGEMVTRDILAADTDQAVTQIARQMLADACRNAGVILSDDDELAVYQLATTLPDEAVKFARVIERIAAARPAA